MEWNIILINLTIAILCLIAWYLLKYEPLMFIGWKKD